MLYPLKFKPRLVEKIWGGRKIEAILGKRLPPDRPIGESWELYDFPPGVIEGESGWVSSEVANGPLAGRSLHAVISEFGRALHGDVPLLAPHNQFPILLKYLDARENLSVQVHPTPEYAATHPGAHVKTEAWYVVQADEHARIFKGLNPGVTRQQFEQALADGSVEPLLRSIPARPGHSFYLPSGTLHALCAGTLVAEVQTPSDTTFRVYDFNRIDPSSGKPRALHIPQALACIDFDKPEAPPPPRSHVAGYFTTVTRLVSSPYFRIEKVRFTEGVEEPVPYDQPVVWMMLEGKAQVRVEGVPGLHEPVSFGKGDSVLLPAEMHNAIIRTETDCVWLEVTFPTKAEP